jgi:UDP-N-acetylglucosamine 3-dehydrogenase
MRVGMAGLAALYWPVAVGRGLQGREKVAFVAAATLGVEPAAILQTLGMSAEEYAARFGVRLYEQAEEMVARERLDTVVLITRHTEHAAWAERMAALGVNLFIPKTFATSMADAERIAEAGKRYGVTIAVGPSPRFLPPMMGAQEALQRGAIGAPFSLRICHHHGTIDAFGAQDWYREVQEGGPELSLGWYGIDLAIYFMGSGFRSVYAEYGNYTTPNSPFMDCGRIVLRAESGTLASFDMYFCNRVAYPSWQMEIVGPGGVISLHRSEGDPLKTVLSLDGPQGYERLPTPERTPGWETYWIEDLLAGREPTISAEVASTITRISLAAAESARTGVPVAL